MLVRIVDFDEYSKEATVEICMGNMQLIAYAYPCFGKLDPNAFGLYSFLTSNIIAVSDMQSPVKINDGFWSYRVTGEVVDSGKPLVKVGEIMIELDTSLPSDIRNGMLVMFDTRRLDLQQ